MDAADPLIRNISDTARWVAVYRARESERPDALFRDPFARRLAGERGERIAAGVPFAERHAWSFAMRTHLIDRFIAGQVAAGVGQVVNLAAGLDARPYRMALPPALRWVEVDLPELLDYKADVLAKETPACALERVPLDLADVAARRALVARLGARAATTLVVTEGLVVYLSAAEVASLADDLADGPGFARWVLDMHSPGLLRLLQRGTGAQLAAADSPMRFGPPEGPGFFVPHGWTPLAVRSALHAGAELGRLSFWMRLAALFPASAGKQGAQPWKGICLFGNARRASGGTGRS